MIRKAVKLGPSTLVMSLPKEWVTKQQVKPGNEILVEMAENKLICSVFSKNEKSSATLDYNLIKHLHLRILMACYMKGIDEVEIHCNNSQIIKRILTRTDIFIGYEVIEQSSKHVVIKDLGTTEKDLTNLTNRIFFLLQNMLDELLENGQSRAVSDIELHINKFCEYCQRVNAKQEKSMYWHTIFVFLEMLGDEIKQINKVNSKRLSQLKELLESLRSLCAKPSYEKCAAFGEQYDKSISQLKQDSIEFRIADLQVKIMNQLLFLV